ncbi:hypothetical protein Tco_1434388, partial [Tanacetum coccineum]
MADHGKGKAIMNITDGMIDEILDDTSCDEDASSDEELVLIGDNSFSHSDDYDDDTESDNVTHTSSDEEPLATSTSGVRKVKGKQGYMTISTTCCVLGLRALRSRVEEVVKKLRGNVKVRNYILALRAPRVDM